MEDNTKTYKLGEFAKLMNVSTKSLQRWDKNGVLVADRTDGYHRSYTQKHIEQLQELQINNSSKLTRKKNYKFKDLTDMHFDKLHVIRRDEDWISPNGHRHIQWLCECDCGNQVTIKGSSLNAGYNKSCGCSQYGDSDTKRMWTEFNNLSEDVSLDGVVVSLPDKPTVEKKPASHGRREDLTNRTFGFWTVVKQAATKHYPGGGQAICWECRCKCGTVKSVPARDLKSGASRSCGCMSSMSWSEYYVREYLDTHNISYEYQKKYYDLKGVGGKLLSYDFVLVKNGEPFAVIECQGEQHYRPIKKFGGAKQLLKQQMHDKLKCDYALSVLHVPLYEIPYTYQTMEDIYSRLDTFNL